ncbi:MAG: 2-C-methyl-D-erythritol 4-phosphate cytidylyltransferase [Erysipelotrichaceae bacterium]|nr:2-C-methyl-D-erythritol 4-phosphate cytidylyltransferase [Erysipelotrichaceae bacterium]MDY5252884.1 2-C-methyl-D-erythritol 4-phosphate cytidylyltransferase [Erysipelotrichaceae bacterium]
MEYAAVIVAAGKGSRMNLGYNKVYYKLDDKCILEHTIAKFKADKDCKQIIVVCDKADFQANIDDHQVILVDGGATRSDSVYNGLLRVEMAYVMIHDGARPYVSNQILTDVKTCLRDHDACVVMVKCKDTIKRVIDGKVELTYDRSTLMQAQTPQAFKTTKIIACYQKAIVDQAVTSDDASVYELYGQDAVYCVEGSYDNIKITTIEDLK